MKQLFDFFTVDLSPDETSLVILDQTRLPGETVYLTLREEESIWDAIRTLKVRGAPAIGVAAGYGICVLAQQYETGRKEDLLKEVRRIRDYLGSSRPTAVNLFWALDRMTEKAEECVKALPEDGPEAVRKIKECLKEEARKIHKEDRATCEAIGRHCLTLLEPGMGILTHCNAGALATAGIGTALAPLYLGQEQGYGFKVYADETRPLLQGARLTAWELNKAGVDVTLICDNMACSVMKSGKIRAVITGADRIAANGDSANKIGTSGVAVLAKEFGIPMYICAPLSTVDLNTPAGADIQIEERPGEEIIHKWYERPMAPEDIKTYNPAFDVTDAEYITAIITEKGVARPPFRESLREMQESE
ncbi:MAG: S-methyl-5-thioribose-1-phosphate isomerase [Firmicutes bacterium]|nr:S-methyl-5-thioribose-1-phosphate isomerase [Bacillota bacterium]